MGTKGALFVLLYKRMAVLCTFAKSPPPPQCTTTTARLEICISITRTSPPKPAAEPEPEEAADPGSNFQVQVPGTSSQQPAAMPILPPRFPSWKFGGISLQGRAKTRRVRHFRDWPPHQKQKPKRMGRTGLAGHRMETDGVYGRLLNARLLRVEPPSAPSPASRSEVGG